MRQQTLAFGNKIDTRPFQMRGFCRIPNLIRYGVPDDGGISGFSVGLQMTDQGRHLYRVQAQIDQHTQRSEGGGPFLGIRRISGRLYFISQSLQLVSQLAPDQNMSI